MGRVARGAWLGLAWLLLLAFGAVPVSAQSGGGTAGPASANGTHRAALVVRFADGKVQTACVSFAAPTITGQQLLQRSGFKTIVDSGGALGGAICSINDQGCSFPKQDCFCRCTGSQCEYWAYYQWQQGAWSYSQAGAAAVKVSDGDLQGWSWGPGNFSSGTEPPVVAFADVCAANAVSAPTGAGAPAAQTPAVAPAGSGAMLQYVAYAAILLLLIGAGVFVMLRRRV
jgi:hypothetical protein